ncbi:MAG TPA: hypothetical protein VHH11_14065 [Gammaproteobacteria bacterium]|nr:hypothetical protein [Gammaproteobacteria bacterium]
MGEKTIPKAAVGRGDLYIFDPFRLVIVGYDTDDGEAHPLYDERVRDLDNVDPAWVANVAANGILTPIGVVRDGDRVLVKFGRHRVVWARRATEALRREGAPGVKVPGYYARSEDKVSLGLIVAENEIRRADALLAKARKAARLCAHGYSVDDCATQFGVSVATIRNWLQLIEASAPVLRAVERGELGASAATELARLPRADQPAALTEALAKGAGAREIAETVRAKRRGETPSAARPMRPTVGVLRRVVAHLETHADDVDPLVFQTLRWAAGLVDARSVRGLTAVLRAAGLEPE